MKSIHLQLLIPSLLLLQKCHETTAFVATPNVAPRVYSTMLSAKKKKGGKKNSKEKKQSGFAWAASFASKPFESAALRELASVACASFEGRTGKPLAEELKGSLDIPKTLWNAPVACMIVGEGDNIIQYANILALETVGIRAENFEQLLAAKDPTTGEWKAPETVLKLGLPASMKGDKKYDSGYSKKIIKGDPGISLEDANRWVLEKSVLVNGKFVTESLGVAYSWSSWMEGEETLCKADGVRELKIGVGQLEERIKAQGEKIKEMKEVQGLGNKDPEVSEAVQDLLKMKAMLEKVNSK